MPDYVRVKNKDNGVHHTVLASEVEANADAYQVLKQAAVDHNGDPLPAESPDAPAQPAAQTKEK